LAIAGGILGILAGVIALLTASTNATGDGSLNFSNLIQGIFLLIGIWTRNAAIAFKRVVNTHGRDVWKFDGSPERAAKVFYTLQYWLWSSW